MGGLAPALQHQPNPLAQQLVLTLIVLASAAVLAGALNALAGGGSLVTFPALLFAGLNPIDANASSVVALFPATFASVWAYRHSIFGVTEVSVTSLSIVSLIGGVCGALLLLSTPTSVFAGLVPWLVLLSTIIFAVGNFAPLDVMRRLELGPRGALAAHFVVSLYGGYFGGGIGFLLLAALTLFGMRDINAMNGLKMWLVGIMTVASIAVFIVADVIRWAEVLPMLLGSVIGGYAAARVAQRLDQRLIKWFIIVWGVAVTTYFFWRGV
jgi:uncharacterized membrane protein YfcA